MAFTINGTAGPITGQNDEVDGFPAGGHADGVGFHIDWQATPLGDGPAGAFVEDVILARIQRLSFYQDRDEEGSGRFRCEENQHAITKLNEALASCHQRTQDRERRGVEGSHHNDHGAVSHAEQR